MIKPWLPADPDRVEVIIKAAKQGVFVGLNRDRTQIIYLPPNKSLQVTDIGTDAPQGTIFVYDETDNNAFAHYTYVTKGKGGYVADRPDEPVVPSIEITQQPSDTIAIRTTNTFFTFNFADDSGVSTGYYWEVSQDQGATYTKVEGSDSLKQLTIENVEIALDGNWYRAVVTSAGENIYTNPAKLEVQYIPITITKQPENVSVSAGKDAVFSFEYEGDAATAQMYYQGWEKLVDGEWATIGTRNNLTLTLDGVLSADSGSQYRGFVTSAQTPYNRVYTSVVTLTVTAFDGSIEDSITVENAVSGGLYENTGRTNDANDMIHVSSSVSGVYSYFENMITSVSPSSIVTTPAPTSSIQVQWKFSQEPTSLVLYKYVPGQTSLKFIHSMATELQNKTIDNGNYVVTQLLDIDYVYSTTPVGLSGLALIGHYQDSSRTKTRGFTSTRLNIDVQQVILDSTDNKFTLCEDGCGFWESNETISGVTEFYADYIIPSATVKNGSVYDSGKFQYKDTDGEWTDIFEGDSDESSTTGMFFKGIAHTVTKDNIATRQYRLHTVTGDVTQDFEPDKLPTMSTNPTFASGFRTSVTEDNKLNIEIDMEGDAIGWSVRYRDKDTTNPWLLMKQGSAIPANKTLKLTIDPSQYQNKTFQFVLGYGHNWGIDEQYADYEDNCYYYFAHKSDTFDIPAV